MIEILSVEQGDRFGSVGTETILEVVKIWFEFSQDDQRWETSVTWDAKNPLLGDHQLSAKGRDFIKILRDGGFVRLHNKKADESFALGAMTEPSGLTAMVQNMAATTTPPSSFSADPKRQMWEADFRRTARKYGMFPSDLGRKVVLNGKESRFYTLVGAKPRNWKMPILIQSQRGGIYKITAEKAKAGLR